MAVCFEAKVKGYHRETPGFFLSFQWRYRIIKKNKRFFFWEGEQMLKKSERLDAEILKQFQRLEKIEKQAVISFVRSMPSAGRAAAPFDPQRDSSPDASAQDPADPPPARRPR